MKFSVLLSIYCETQIDQLSDCVDSLLAQTMLPDELVFVLDGPVSAQCEAYLTDLQKEEVSVTLVHLEVNQGLGMALQRGLDACNNEWVARMDTDDRCAPDRFKIQCTFIQNNPQVSAVSGTMLELYAKGTGVREFFRNTPVSMPEIRRLCRYRNPMNHPCVMYRKSDVLAVGGYQPLHFLEDYYLWMRLISANYSLANLTEVLVISDIDTGLIDRRRGIGYIKSEWKLASEMRRLKLNNMVGAFLVFLVRALLRLLPGKSTELIYLTFLRQQKPVVS